MSFESAAAGTPAAAWRESGVRERAAALDIGAVHRLVVLAAHPDDETLSAGGLLHAVAATGRPVLVVVATLGEASHPRSTTTTPAELGRRREVEVRAAIDVLAPANTPVLLRLPDGDLRTRSTELRDTIRGLIRAGDTVVAPWRGDGHPDHEAVGEIAAQVTGEIGAPLLEAPIWAWHWSGVDAPWPRAVRFDLDEKAAAAKAAALAHHASQIAPLSPEAGDEALLSPEVLAHFTGPAELFFPSGGSKVDFDAMYRGSDDPWGFTERWYERRKRASTMAALPLERFERALEIGCSIGVLTDLLADRADEVLAVDVASRAVELARERLHHRLHVRIERRSLPDEWPAGAFDLIVLSETGFYLTRAQLHELGDQIRGSLAPAGVVVLCHWRPHVAGLEIAGDEVHEILRARLGYQRLVRHVEDDFLLEVLQAAPTRSVATATGLRP